MAQSFTSLHREREYLLSVFQNHNAKAVKLVNQLAQAERKLEYHLALLQSPSTSMQIDQEQKSPRYCQADDLQKTPEQSLGKAIKQQKSRCRKYRGLLKRTEAQEKAILNSLGRVTYSILAKERWLSATEAQMAQFLPPWSGQASSTINGRRSANEWWHNEAHYHDEGQRRQYLAASESINHPLSGFAWDTANIGCPSGWAGQQVRPYDDHLSYSPTICSDSLSLQELDESILPATELHSYKQETQSLRGLKPNIYSLEHYPDQSTLNVDDLAASILTYHPFNTSLERHKYQSSFGSHQQLSSNLVGPERRASEANWMRGSQFNRDKTRAGSLPMTLFEAPKFTADQVDFSEAGYLGYAVSNGQLGCVSEE